MSNIDITAIRRELKIKSGVVHRLTKENGLYRKEADQLEAKKNKFIADGAENWDISNATKMMEESKKMIHDTATRLEKAVELLVALITSAKGKTGLTDAEELIKAEEILKVAQGVDLKVALITSVKGKTESTDAEELIKAEEILKVSQGVDLKV